MQKGSAVVAIVDGRRRMRHPPTPSRLSGSPPRTEQSQPHETTNEQGELYMSERSELDTRQLALIDCFAKGTWIALSLALVALAVDAYAIFYMPHRPFVAHGETQHSGALFPVALWTLEITLAVLALWLVRFAFSRAPKFIPGG